MNNLKKTVFILTECIIALFLIQLIVQNPIQENITCEHITDTQNITCTRTLKFIFHKKEFNYLISNPQTIKLDEKTDARADYITVDFFISAISENGSKIVLLSVPEKNIAYATELVQKMQRGSGVDFKRSMIPETLLMIGALLLLGFIVGVSFLKKNK